MQHACGSIKHFDARYSDNQLASVVEEVYFHLRLEGTSLASQRIRALADVRHRAFTERD